MPTPEDFRKNLHLSMGQSTTEDKVPSEALRVMGAVTATDIEKVLLTSSYRSHRLCPGGAFAVQLLVEGFVCLTFILCDGLSSLPFYC